MDGSFVNGLGKRLAFGFALCVTMIGLVGVLTGYSIGLVWRQSISAEQAKPEVTRYQAGYEVGKAGFPPDCCPYSGDNYGAMLRKEWMAGWMEGARERAEMGKGVKD